MEKLFKGVKFQIDDSRACAYFVLGVRKSGSTMLNRLCAALAKTNSMNVVDIPGSLFKQDVPVKSWINDPDIEDLIHPANVYMGYRNFPKMLSGRPIFSEARKILLVRDPRDALVSEYFSNAYSHRLPDVVNVDGGAARQLLEQRQRALNDDVNDYVLARAQLMDRTILPYAELLNDPMTKIFKYEDIIFRKREFAREILDHFGWQCEETRLHKIVETVDVFPTTEVKTNFVRKVSPGDHRDKLDAETIALLNQELRDSMQAFGYA
jgi:hypothetical protein